MNWVDKLIDKYHTDITENTDNPNNINNKMSVKSVDKSKVIFYASVEGTNEKVPYSYSDLENTFKEGFTDDSIKFIHMAKKYGEIKFIKEINKNE